MPNTGQRGRESAGAVLLRNTRNLASQVRNFHRGMRGIGSKGPIKASEKMDAKDLFKKLKSIFTSGLTEMAREVYSDRDDQGPKNSDRLKKIALALYLEGYLNDAHRHALKANVAGDFALFLTAFDSVLEFLEKDFFSKPLEQNRLDFIVLKGTLDACAEACRIASLDYDAAREKYSWPTVEFVRQVESEDQKSA